MKKLVALALIIISSFCFSSCTKMENRDASKKLNVAYEVLGDEQKRKTYDQFGSAAFEQGAPGNGGYSYGGANFNGMDFSDIFWRYYFLKFF